MESENIATVGDLIKFLQELDPEKKVLIYDEEWETNNPLQYIVTCADCVILYD